MFTKKSPVDNMATSVKTKATVKKSAVGGAKAKKGLPVAFGKPAGGDANKLAGTEHAHLLESKHFGGNGPTQMTMGKKEQAKDGLGAQAKEMKKGFIGGQ